MSLIGQTLLNQYRIDKFIADTSLGKQYRAFDLRYNKYVGLTVLPKAISEDAEKLKELDAKTSAFKKYSHPDLISYLGILQTPTLAFLLEDWADGPSLQDVMNSNLLSANEALIYVRAICNALEYLHKNNYVHGGLSPQIIHVTQNGAFLLGGIVLIQRSGERQPTRVKRPLSKYAAPEQIAKQPITPSADIYSLSAIIYESITGAIPKGQPPRELNPTISDRFSRMLMWGLRKDNTRLSSTTELLSTLALALQLNVDEVPLRATPEVAPVTAVASKDWPYLPLPQPSLISTDTIPLEERLASVTSQSTKEKRWYWRYVMAGFFLIGIIFVIGQVRPIEKTYTLPPSLPTREVTIPANRIISTQTSTPLPKPTDTHGGRILFTCTRGDYNQLCVINADGSGYKRVSDQLANDYYPAFAPQGGAFVFSSNRNGAFDIYLFVIATNDLFQLTDHIGNVVSPNFSPDGQKIVFANRASTGPTSIWIVDRKGINPRLIYTGPNAIVATAWSPDGNTIAYALQQDSPNEYQIFLMDTNGSHQRRLTNGLLGVGGNVAWSPDGKSILIYAGPIGDKDIFSIDAATGNYIQLTFGGNNAAASYSPDGKYIVFNSLRNNDQADLYIMNADGHSTRQLTDDPEPDWQPVWEP